MRLILINSCGPMASSMVAAVLEKMGVRNLPLRDIGLNEYITGEIPLSSKYMEEQTLWWIDFFSKPVNSGGVSTVDRDKRKARPLTDPAKVAAERTGLLKREFSSLSEKFHYCRSVFEKSLVYKSPLSNVVADGHLCRNFDYYHRDPEDFWKKCREAFPGVQVIHLHRNFRPWIVSMMAQSFHQPKFRHRLRFEYSHLYRKYHRYEKFCGAVEGGHLDFSQIVQPDTGELARILCNQLELDFAQLNWGGQTYDLYGALSDHKTTFTPFDDQFEYVSRRCLDCLLRYANPDGAAFPRAALIELRARLIYLFALWSYRRRIN